MNIRRLPRDILLFFCMTIVVNLGIELLFEQQIKLENPLRYFVGTLVLSIVVGVFYNWMHSKYLDLDKQSKTEDEA